MNCPSRTDEALEDRGWNQSPPMLAADLTTRQDLNGIANLRLHRHQELPDEETKTNILEPVLCAEEAKKLSSDATANTSTSNGYVSTIEPSQNLDDQDSLGGYSTSSSPRPPRPSQSGVQCLLDGIIKFGKFVGPGFMISVAYIDPGNYSTDVAAGASTRFGLLFIVLLSNIFAIVLQSLAIRLGTVTGMNLAEHCRAHLPRWLNIALYILAEAAIIATDIAEVIGSAIALNLLLKIPLVAGCALTLVDVLVILIFYNPDGSMRRLRAFELFVMALVLGVVVCFCIQLSFIQDTPIGEVFKGYLPSSTIVKGQGIYLSCGILGATVMPHSLYLGSGLVQARLKNFDELAGNIPSKQTPPSTKAKPPSSPKSIKLLPAVFFSRIRDLKHNASSYSSQIAADSSSPKTPYRPSLAAIRSCLTYSTFELAISLFTFALFVNSAILIVAGSSLSSDPGASDASLFAIHDLLSHTLAPIAGTLFALALLLSGTSAGIVCTIAGQMVSEGALNWKVAPWLRRLLTRSISVTPSIIIAGAVGANGVSAALNGTQVALSVILPFVSAPLIYFTCRDRFMTVRDGENNSLRQREPDREAEVSEGGRDVENAPEPGGAVVKMGNSWIVCVFAGAIWLVIAIMNVALLVLVGMGKA